MALYLTGRTRTLTWSGGLLLSGKAKIVCDDGFAAAEGQATALAQIVLFPNNPFPLQIDAIAGVGGGTGLQTCSLWELFFEYDTQISLAIDDGLGGTDSDIVTDTQGPGLTLPHTQGDDWTGSWSVTLDVEEIMSVEDLDPSKVDADNFPLEPSLSGSLLTGYGSAIHDHLKGKRVVFLERARDGGELNCSVTLGAASASTTTTITTGNRFIVNYLSQFYISTACGFEYTGPPELDAQGEITFQFQGVDFPGEAYLRTNGGAEADCDVGIVRVTAAGESCNGQAIYLGHPVISYDFQGRAAMVDGSAGSMVVDLHYKKDTDIAQITCNPTGTKAKWDQETYGYDSVLKSVAQTSASKDEIADPRCWLDVATLTSAGDDPEDWRGQFLGAKWNAFGLKQEGSYTLDDGSSTSGWAGSGVSVSTSGGNLILS